MSGTRGGVGLPRGHGSSSTHVGRRGIVGVRVCCCCTECQGSYAEGEGTQADQEQLGGPEGEGGHRPPICGDEICGEGCCDMQDRGVADHGAGPFVAAEATLGAGTWVGGAHR